MVYTKNKQMKKLLFFVILSVSLFRCLDKNSVEIPALGSGVESDRKVLIEEFTGVRCVNCPDGSAEIQNLLALHGENLIAISIHSGFFSKPYDENKYDFRTADGDAIASLLGEPQAFPTAIIDRRLFAGQNERQLSKQSWAGYIQNELAESPKFNISMESDFDEANRSLNVKVIVIPLENVSENLNLSVLLTEDDIEDYQITPAGKIPDYKHKHVFRRVLTNDVSGVGIGSSFTKGQSVEMNFSATISVEWKANNCHIVSFVHKNGTDLDVLQAEQIKMQ